MTLGQALFTYLSTKAAIVAVVGTRVFPIEVARNQTVVYPCITFQLISTRQQHSLGGASQLAWKRYQVTSWSKSANGANSAEALAELVRLACDGYAGTWGTVDIQSCLHDGEGDSFDLPSDNENAKVYGRRQDYQIAYTESQPTL